MFHKTFARKSTVALIVLMVVALLSVSAVAGAAVGSGKLKEKPLAASRARPAEGPKDVPGELIVTFKHGVSRAAAANTLAAKGGKQKGSMRGGLVRLVKVPADKIAEALERLRQDPIVANVEANHVVRAAGFPQDAAPNDTNFSYQWNFPQIRVPDAWKIADGAGVTVAVIDTGVAYENYGIYTKQPDLAGAAFADGWDYVNNDSHPNDDYGHGTHVTGTIAQTTNNSLGEAGIAFGATIMPIKVLDAEGVGTDFQVAQGIRFAADHGADIINLSLGSTDPSTAEQEAIDYAVSKNVLVVAAAGNGDITSGYLGTSTPFYPAAYPGVISVGAVRYDRARSYYSNYGSSLDIVAPGGDLYVDQNGDGYGDGILQQTFDLDVPTDYGDYFFQGTSMASPHVAGVAALVMSAGTTNTTAVEQILTETADDLGVPGRDNYYGFGEVNAAAAVTSASSFNTVLSTTPAWPDGANGWYKSPTTVKLFRSKPGVTYYWWESNPAVIVETPASVATVSAPEGTDTLHYYSVDSSGTTESPLPTPLPIKVDTHAPTTPVFMAPAYSSDVSKTNMIPLSWTPASDGTGSLVAGYELQYQDMTTSHPVFKAWRYITGTSVDFPSRPGKTYRFRVWAKDNAGNFGPVSSYKTTRVPYDDRAATSRVGFNGAYINTASRYYLGTIRYTRRAGEKISMTATTKRFVLIGTAGNRSRAKIYIDGRFVKEIDPRYTKGYAYRRRLFNYRWSSVGRHTITVENLATRGRPQFDVDGFAAER